MPWGGTPPQSSTTEGAPPNVRASPQPTQCQHKEHQSPRQPQPEPKVPFISSTSTSADKPST